MKFFVKEEERKPDPAPLKTNARAVVVVGIVSWALVLALFVLVPTATPAGKQWWLTSCVFGIILGVLAWFKVGRR